jgi:hypothetical protein
MAPTNCRAASRGNCVSVSRVMTYRTSGQHRRVTDDERETVLAPRRLAAARSAPPACRACARSPSRSGRGRIPSPRAMEEEEDVPPRPPRAYFSLSSSIRRPCQLQQRSVGGERFLPGVAKIGQQAEVQVLIAIRQKPDLQRLDQLLDVRLAGEHGRHHHQRPRDGPGCLRRSPSWAAAAASPAGRQPVHQRHGQLADAASSTPGSRSAAASTTPAAPAASAWPAGRRRRGSR